jgi:hypothetical protein
MEEIDAAAPSRLPTKWQAAFWSSTFVGFDASLGSQAEPTIRVGKSD